MGRKMFTGAIWKKERCICVHVYSGITSRCISLSQAYYLAKKYNISNVIVIWQLEKWCNIKYDDVFDKEQFKDVNLIVMNYKFFPPNWGEGVKAYVRKGQIGKVLSCLREWVLYLARKLYNCRAQRLMDYFREKDTYVRYDPPAEIGWDGKAYGEWIIGCWKRIKQYLEKKVNFCAGIYCGLIKDEEMEESVDISVLIFRDKFYKIANALVPKGGGTWIGVHVRRTDHRASIEESTLDSFICKMKEIMADHEAVRFFLATDDRDVEKELSRVFPGRIYTYSNKTWGRNSRLGMESAIVDCLCLSRCDCILGSYQSVFSKFSTMYGNIELIVCRK